MAFHPNKRSSAYDVIVVGAGPAGCEAALAAAAPGASCLCLAINLDATGFPAGSPVLSEGEGDPRSRLLAEMKTTGGTLPALVTRNGIRVHEDRGNVAADGQVLIDRRELGLAYKEQLESSDGVFPRQALVTAIEPADGGWCVATNLAERYFAATVIIAAGTFLNGEVLDAGRRRPGGRRGEIPSRSLTLSLQNTGFSFIVASVASSLRLDSRDLAASGAGNRTSRNSSDFPADGSRLNERYGRGIDASGNMTHQLATVREASGAADSWVTRISYIVNHMMLDAAQLEPSLASSRHGGIFFAGRAAGGSGYVEAASLGLTAGKNAALFAMGKDPDTPGTGLAARLCRVVALSEQRPVAAEDAG